MILRTRKRKEHRFEDLLETALKPALKPGVTTAKFLKPEEKKNFINWRVINLFIFSGFKNFAVVTAGFKAGFKPVSRTYFTDHPRRHVPRTMGMFHAHVTGAPPLQEVALSLPKVERSLESEPRRLEAHGRKEEASESIR